MKVKKVTVVIVVALVALCFLYIFASGFHKRTDVLLTDFSVSEDGTSVTLHVTVPTSMGYVRGFQNTGGSVKPHYLTFYSTFGGLNSSWGAKSEFILPLDEADTEIYFNRPDGGYMLVLVKNSETGQWEIPVLMLSSDLEKVE